MSAALSGFLTTLHREFLKIMVKHEAFTPDRAIDPLDVQAEFLGIDRHMLYFRFDARELERFCKGIKKAMGVREADGKIYLDIRKYFKDLILAFVEAAPVGLSPFIFMLIGSLIDFTGFIFVASGATAGGILVVLAMCQPLLSYVIRTRRGRRRGAG